MTPAEKMAQDKKNRVGQERQERWRMSRQVIFNCKIREMREGLGLSSRDVGKGAGVGHVNVTRAESGYGVNLHTAMKLAKFFGKKIEDIWSLREES
jgi:DNA-binding XRE family transcriptional regulator